MDEAQRRLRKLSWEESLELLGGVPVGRVVFSLRALPAVRVVNHVLDDGAIVFRTHEDAAIVRTAGTPAGSVVAYQADAIDGRDRSGWSVVVTGVARLVTDPAATTRYLGILEPWVEGERGQVIRIEPEIVSGFLLTPAAEPATNTTAP